MTPPHNVIALRPRTLANVLLDIAEQNAANREIARRSDAAYKAGDRAEEDHLGDVGAAIDRRLSDLHDEACTMILQATGVTWEQLYGALA